MINIKQYAHPLDRKMIDKILSSSAGRELVDTIMSNNLDDICDYALENSYARLPKDSSLYDYLSEGQQLFGTPPIRALYVERDYEYETVCHGLSHPVVIVPDTLLKRDDQDIFRARMLAAAAAIAMGHHKIEFLLWMMETMSGSIPLPVVPEIVQGFFYEWFRCRRYTTDRAVWLATGDRALAAKNILYGHIPFEMLERFVFGTNHDTFLSQISELESMKGLSGTAAKIIGVMQKESWLPNRYIELNRFIQTQERGGGDGGN